LTRDKFCLNSERDDRIFCIGVMIRIGTRGSELALWQAGHVADLIGRKRTEIVVIKTKGDRVQNLTFDKMEGKGFFTKEIEDALLKGRIDVAVHSMKDLPTDDVPGLKIVAVTGRDDPSDLLLIRWECYNPDNSLPLFDGAAVGTSSLRRAAQLRHLMDSIRIMPLRGNVTTRVRKLREKQFDAIVLAKAGVQRLKIDLDGLRVYVLPLELFLPAPAQGALAIQIRADDGVLEEQLKMLNHRDTDLAVSAERFFLKYFGGGCHIPLGAHAHIEGEIIHLEGVVASLDGKSVIRKSMWGREPSSLGEELAHHMKEEGADRFI
jgi:hydroxymethylbilane synthase